VLGKQFTGASTRPWLTDVSTSLKFNFISISAPFDKEITMRMSTKGRFAVTAMMEVALRERSGPVSLAGIGSRQNMSLSYLEQLFSRLRRHGLVESTRGPGGGYTLGRRAEEITVADIIVAVDSDDEETGRTEGATSRQVGESLTGELWGNLNAKMIEYMDGITLYCLVQEQVAKGLPMEVAPAKRSLVSKISNTAAGLRINAPNSVFAFGRSFASST
jgi:Rrf2 family transcriptional regulator, iron-sulfur cluster assembly transcription factor